MRSHRPGSDLLVLTQSPPSTLAALRLARIDPLGLWGGYYDDVILCECGDIIVLVIGYWSLVSHAE